MSIIKYCGPRGMTYGYRFTFRGRQHLAMIGPTEQMAKDAERKERARLALASYEGAWGPLRPRRTPVAEAVERFLEAKKHKRSLDMDRSRLRWWAAFLEDRGIHYLQELDPDSVMAGRHQLAKDGRKDGTVYQYMAVLRTLGNVAVRRWRLLRENPLLAVDWPRPQPKDVRLPTAAEFRLLLKKADPLLRPIILTAVYTGMREGAVIRLQAEDRLYRKGWLRGSEEKGDKTVWIFETPELARILDGQRVMHGSLFRWEDGRPMTRFPRKRWNKARMAAGIPWFDFHGLRHMAGHLLAEDEVPVRTIQRMLGHASAAVTERYTQGLTRTLAKGSQKLARRIEVYRNLVRRPRNSPKTHAGRQD